MRTKKRPKGNFLNTPPSSNSAESLVRMNRLLNSKVFLILNAYCDLFKWSRQEVLAFCIVHTHLYLEVFKRKVSIHDDYVNVAGAGWSSGGQPSHGYADHIFFVQIFHSIFTHSQPMAFSTYATDKCSYDLFIIQILSWFLPRHLRASTLCRKIPSAVPGHSLGARQTLNVLNVAHS